MAMMLEKVSIDTVPAEVPRLAREDCALANLLATRRLSVDVALEGADNGLRLATAGPLKQPRTAFAGRLDGEALLLSFDDDQLPAFLPDLAAGIRLSELPGALAMAAAEVAFRPLLDALADALGAVVALDAVAPGLPEDWPAIALLPNEDSADAPLATLHPGPEAAAVILRRLDSLPGAANWEAAAVTYVPLAAQLAGSPLSLAELAALAYGDVLLLPPGAKADAVEIFAGNRTRRIGRGRRAENSITIDSVTEDAMPDSAEDEAKQAPEGGDATEPEETSGGEAVLSVEEIEISIGFSLGQRLVSVAELRSLSPGYTFELEPAEAGEVGIVANGREVGRGELVRIDDRLGVRILRLSEKSHG